MKEYWAAMYGLPSTHSAGSTLTHLTASLNAAAEAGWRIVSTAKTGSEQFAPALVVVWERDLPA
jgi:hypothetical protein